MKILYKTSATVLRADSSSTKITIPKLIADQLELFHKQKLEITLTEDNIIVIERMNTHESE